MPIFLSSLLILMPAQANSDELADADWVALAPEIVTDPPTYFGGREIAPEEPDIPFSEGPLRRFEITFFIAMPFIYFYNTLILDLVVNTMRTYAWQDGWQGTRWAGSNINNNDTRGLFLQITGVCPEGCPMQYQRSLPTDNVWLYTAVSAILAGIGIAFADLLNVFVRDDDSSGFTVPYQLDSWRAVYGVPFQEGEPPQKQLVFGLPLITQRF